MLTQGHNLTSRALTVRAWLNLVALAAGLACGAVATRAQSSAATLAGTVSDERGAVITGVEVAAVSKETGARRTSTTNGDGYFVISPLPPGPYTVTARRQGFATVEVKGVVLNVNDQRSLQIQLRVGEISEAITVEEAQVIELESAAVSTLVDRQFVENLPLNGRSFSTLIELTSGVVLTKPGSGGQFSVNGQRANANYFMVDGVGANVAVKPGVSLAQTAGGTVPAYNILGGTSNLVSVDALQEFRIQTSTYAPEFGRTPGAQVSVVTRSGTNQLHGSLFDYFRNDALDANDWFANSRGLAKPALRQNDFGGVLGGPLVRNRTFFFVSYEGLSLRQPQFGITMAPTLSARASAPPQLKPYLDAFPIPNGRDLGDGFAESFAGYSNPSTLNATSVRVDHTAGSKLTLFGRFNYAPSETTQRAVTEGLLNNLETTRLKTETLTLGATQTLSAKSSNDLRVNYSRSSAKDFFRLDNFAGGVPPPDSVLFSPFAKPQESFFLFLVGPVNYLVGGAGLTNFQRQLNVVDNLSLTARTHQLKFGADYRRLTPSLATSKATVNALYDDVDAVIANSPSFVGVAASPDRFPLFTNFSAYAQDSWRATSRLTLTYGLRWELNTPPSDRRGNDPFTVTGLDNPATMTLAPRGTPLWQTAYDNFAPRVGVAYQVSQAKGRETVLRGGFGLFYDVGTGPSGNAFLAGGFPYLTLFTLPNAFPIDYTRVSLPALNRSPSPPYGDLVLFDPHLKLPVTYQWNVAVEQSLGSHQTITASYVGAAGRRLLRQEVMRGASLPNPNFTRLRVIRNAATSDYHALQLQFQRRLARGLQALASYTWSHSIDIASVESTLALSTTRIEPKADRGSSNFDVRHSASGAVTYDIPTPGLGRLARPLLRNWSIDSLFRARTATPVDLLATSRQLFGVFNTTRPDLIAGVPLYLSDSTVAGGRRINRAAFAVPPPNRQGTLGRNVLRGFPLSQLDFALRRRFSIKEPFNLQLRADFFNILNHPNFGDPVTNLSSPLFGQSLQMIGRDLGGGDGGLSPLYQVGGPRSIQLALKLLF